MLEGKMTKRPTAAHCRRVPKWPTLASGRLGNNNLFWEESMAQATLVSRIAVGACGALIIGATALAQTPPPALTPPAQAPAAPAAPQFPPTATITTPGYPAVGSADPALRVVSLLGGKKVHLLPATLESTRWGWFDNAQPRVLRVHSGDTIVMETMMQSHNRVCPGVTRSQVKKARTVVPGRAPHTLSGRTYIEEAQPGDVLKVR